MCNRLKVRFLNPSRNRNQAARRRLVLFRGKFGMSADCETSPAGPGRGRHPGEFFHHFAIHRLATLRGLVELSWPMMKAC